MKQSRWLLLLFCVEGLLAFLWTFITPSETGSAVFLWFSRPRLVLVMALFAMWSCALGVTLWLWRSDRPWESIHAELDEWCLEKERFGGFLIILFVIPLVVAVGVLKVALTPLDYVAYRGWAPDTFPLLHSLVSSFLPILLFVLLMAFETGIYLTVRYRQAATSLQTWSWQHIGTTVVLTFIGIVTAFHWMILAFQLRVFTSNPAWYWKIERVPFTVGDLWFVLGALTLLALACWLLILQRRIVIGLIMVFLLGIFLQIGVGIITDGGLVTVTERYFYTYHKAYLQKASQNQLTIVEVVRHYEELYGSQSFVNTKPPGLMAFYIGLEQLINGHPSAYPDDVRYVRLSTVVICIFPLVAMLMVFMVYRFVSRFLPDPSGTISVTAPLLYVVCPNLVLFSLFPDQALYPLLFLLGISLIITIIRRQSYVLAVVLGMFFYVAVFFAFSMLLLYVFTGIYLIVNYWSNRHERAWQQQLLVAGAIGLGTLMLYLLFLYVLNYNFFPRFGRTMAINHNFDFYLRVGHTLPTGPESLSTRLRQIVGAAWLNNLDFAASIGFPIYFLFLVQAVRLLLRFFRRMTDSGDAVPLTFLLCFIVLNLAGTAQGEVPRLWLFWLPMVVIFAAYEMVILARRNRLLLLGVVLAEFITVLLTYHFQDLRM